MGNYKVEVIQEYINFNEQTFSFNGKFQLNWYYHIIFTNGDTLKIPHWELKHKYELHEKVNKYVLKKRVEKINKIIDGKNERY